MPADQLGVKERAALLALMAEAREVSNPELERIAGFRLDGKELRTLRARRLVDSHRSAGNRPYVHLLTDDGWAWCAAELAAERPARAGSAAGALYAVLAGLGRYLARSDLRLSDVFGSDPAGPEPAGSPPAEASAEASAEALAEAPAEAPSASELRERIRAAYRKLARDPRDLVSLTQLRPLLGPAPREAVDAVLRQMSRDREADLVPQANQKTLSLADREAAVRIGNEDCHSIAVDES
jgi:hypothetical protein